MKKLTIDSPEAQSLDLVAENIAKLKALFPELLTEGKDGAAVNVDVLKQLVGDATVTDADEKYGLTWNGKRKARLEALKPSTGTLRPAKADSVDWDTTQNLLIEGDNLEVLKLLQKSYANQVKLIYIDPPYNTGKDFVYPDDYQDNLRNYQERMGTLGVEQNAETSGRFHTDWLNMMHPRLILAKHLLSDDGIIFTSIDDKEVSNLRALYGDVFGDENHVATLIHQRAKGGGQAKQVVKGHDYIIAFAKDINQCQPLRRDKVVQGKTETIDGVEYLIDDDVVRKTFGKYDKNDGDRRCFYEELLKYKSAEKKKEIDDAIAKGELFLQPWGNGMQVIVRRIRIDEAVSKLYSIIKVLSEEGKKDLIALGMEDYFSYPKPVDLVKQLVRSAVSGEGQTVVLDFFAGSGTTGEAVMQLCSTDEVDARYILVQLPEPLNPEKKEQKVAAEFCDKLGKPRTIAELTKERLRRAAAKVKAENPLFHGDLGFRVFKLDTSNLKAWDPHTANVREDLLSHAEHIKPDRTADDLLYELLLKKGLDLAVPMEQKTIASKEVVAIGGGVMLVCQAEAIDTATAEPLALGIAAWLQELSPANPKESVVVFRDSAFEGNVAKSNLAEILKQRGLEKVNSI